MPNEVELNKPASVVVDVFFVSVFVHDVGFTSHLHDETVADVVGAESRDNVDPIGSFKSFTAERLVVLLS